MKRILRWALVLAVLISLGRLPFRAEDVAELVPVKTVIISGSGEEYTVDVGAGIRAAGKTLEEALEHLREQAVGRIFFGTAEQVVVTDAAADALEDVIGQSAFRPAAGLYRTPAEGLDPERVGAYLSTHRSNTTILQVKARRLAGLAPEIPVLVPTRCGYLVYE